MVPFLARRLLAVIAPLTLLLAGCSSEGSFPCGPELTCLRTAEYCVTLALNDGTFEADCLPLSRACSGEPDCDCAETDAEASNAGFSCSSCGLTATNGAAYEVSVECEER